MNSRYYKFDKAKSFLQIDRNGRVKVLLAMAGSVTDQQTPPMTVGVTYSSLNSFLTKISLRLIIAVCTKTDFCFSN